MATIRSFEEMECWKNAREICNQLGRLIDKGAFQKNYRLIHQMEGSSGSIMDNIAEGFERGTRAEFIQFLGYAKGSSGELRSQLYRSFDRGYLTQTEMENLKRLVLFTSGLIQNMIAYLQKTEYDGVRKKS